MLERLCDEQAMQHGSTSFSLTPFTKIQWISHIVIEQAERFKETLAYVFSYHRILELKTI